MLLDALAFKEIFFFSFCPLHMIYATLFQKNRYNYCSAKFNSYFSIIPAISRSLSESAKRKEAWKRFEDVYDLHSWKDLWLNAWLQVPVWLPCTHIESTTIIQLSCTHSFVPSSTAVLPPPTKLHRKKIIKMYFKVRAFNSTKCAFQMANGVEEPNKYNI